MIRLFYLLLLFPALSFAQKINFKSIDVPVKISMRGLSMVGNNVVWASGTNGYVGKSLDGGETWNWYQIKGYEKIDFRDIQAFSAQKAIAMGISSPAYILLTEDGGEHWQEVYKNTEPKIFLDGIDFWNANIGLAVGDPIHNKMQLLRTKDGGRTWEDISSRLKYEMVEGEAIFAASGTAIKTIKGGKVWIATGGVVSNIYFSDNYGDTWSKFQCPILQGLDSQGAFSIDFFNSKQGIVVGGDYKNDKDKSNNSYLTKDGAKTWLQPQTSVLGFRSAVRYLNKDTLVATGTSGIDISYDGGKNWTNISKDSFNAVASNFDTVILVGSQSRMLKITLY